MALVLRVAWVATHDPYPAADYKWYWNAARSIAAGHGFIAQGLPTARWPVGYPAFLGGLFTLTGPSLLVGRVANIALALGIILLATALARRMLGPDRIVGGSAATAEEAAEVMWAGADYVGIGPVFATASKADAGTPLGAEQLARIAGDIEIPVLAVGGITVAEISRVFAAGAHGVAVIGAVASSEDPKAAVQSLRQAIDAALPGES